ncbi:MAG: RIP metalloprotease RseP [Gallionella sp.]|nr:RIP metalloprotease RseP [Gallionella sp.]MDD4947848.1 RIP metalloprotease RseP [Gallionella sp.]MDD5613061.1 RIP metalloprotease RseP [Gallionella sp.]
MTTLLAFAGAIALLVVFHEYGHYWVARRCGVKVLRFSVGFGKVIYSRRFANSDTEWVISAIPLGGYVKMLDEREAEVAPEELDMAFNRKPVWQRMAIVVAGPIANLLLAMVLYWVLFMHGQPGLKPVVGDVPLGSPAAQAQMQLGETILGINGEATPSWQDFRWELMKQALGQDADSPSRKVTVDAETAAGQRISHTLDLGSLQPQDLDGEFLNKLGLLPYQPTIMPVIGKLVEGGVAQTAGLHEDDRILRADGKKMESWEDLVSVVRSHPAQAVTLEIRRGEQTLSLVVVPQAVDETGSRIGKIGAGPKVDRVAWQMLLVEVSYPPFEALGKAVYKTWDTSTLSLKMLGKMLLGQISVKNLSGPITIADYAGQSAQIGWVAYLGFLALISVSLGVLNLLPVPLLDGGHLLYYVAELLKGSPVSEQAWEIGQRIGIAMLGTLMVFAIYNDINRLISG